LPIDACQGAKGGEGFSFMFHNADISKLFRRLANLLEIEDANPFRVRAYRTASQTIDDLARSAAAMMPVAPIIVGHPKSPPPPVARKEPDVHYIG
jgi:hypothetical protein